MILNIKKNLNIIIKIKAPNMNFLKFKRSERNKNTKDPQTIVIKSLSRLLDDFFMQLLAPKKKNNFKHNIANIEVAGLSSSLFLLI